MGRIIVAIIGALAVIIAAIISSHKPPETSPVVPPASTPTPTTIEKPVKGAPFKARVDVSGKWATGQDPSVAHYTLQQSGDSVSSSGDFGEAEGVLSGPDRFSMNWVNASWNAQAVRGHLDWNNGTYWVRPGDSVTPEPANVSGKWASGRDPMNPRWTLQEQDDGTVTSDGDSGHGEGKFAAPGTFVMNWSGANPLTGIVQGNRIYWNNGTYWIWRSH